MKVNQNVKPVAFYGESGEKLTLCTSNKGEPYRDGIDVTFEADEQFFSGFLTAREACGARDFLNEYTADNKKSTDKLVNKTTQTPIKADIDESCRVGKSPINKEDAKEIAEKVAREAIFHINKMYPTMWNDTPKTASVSLQNTIYNSIVRELN
jgi:hypothetical protein